VNFEELSSCKPRDVDSDEDFYVGGGRKTIAFWIGFFMIVLN